MDKAVAMRTEREAKELIEKIAKAKTKEPLLKVNPAFSKLWIGRKR
jgi:hypothetical protein